MTARSGTGRIHAVITTARQMTDRAELLLDIVAPGSAPDATGPSEADAALLGVLLALADLTVDGQQRREADGLAHRHEAAGGVHDSRGGDT